MVSRMPIGCTDGARRPPEGSQNRPTSGNTGVSSYSRVVFWYAKWSIHGFHGFHGFYGSEDMSISWMVVWMSTWDSPYGI